MTERDRKLSSLYYFVKVLSAANSLDEQLQKSVEQIKNFFGFGTMIFFPEDDNKLKRRPHSAKLLTEIKFKSKFKIMQLCKLSIHTII